jgi:hypothetical protein
MGKKKNPSWGKTDTTTKPLESGAFTLEVLAHAGKGSTGVPPPAVAVFQLPGTTHISGAERERMEGDSKRGEEKATTVVRVAVAGWRPAGGGLLCELDGWHVVDDDDYNQSVGNPKRKV